MKSPTSAYRTLKASLGGIKAILSRVPENDCETTLHHLKVQSYILLAHAAFEQYLEELAQEILQESVSMFNKSGVFNQCLVSLIVFETVAQFDDDTPRKKIRADVVANLSKFINIAEKNHVGQIHKNNGIKTKDQRSLLLPIGIDPEEIDAITSANLDAFGIKRGSVAHKVKIQTAETRNSILSIVKAIYEGLKIFDEEACKILRLRMSNKP